MGAPSIPQLFFIYLLQVISLLPVLHTNLMLHSQLSWGLLLQVSLPQTSDSLKVLWE